VERAVPGIEEIVTGKLTALNEKEFREALE
jgi:hypothetical protein